ncbi:GNAT family N-acetyltransferase [Devosia sp. ZB163]|uniref:GNAT family N-acetyltransferase n=1 Tax=Devosia sp. ZB163 TaxID=3025938 RepID=UPI00235ECE9D|nr:GNAT family N-acetyltransferase [Devosia sp. ZB163]MDC9826120.1 GNAT family N-acetyltransferase [Devosia sp. ZB163]
MTAPEIIVRQAVASEAERLTDLALLAWERDLRPFLSGEAASRQNEKRRLGMAVHELLDRTIVAEIDGVPVGWCARARSRAYIPYLFVTPSLQNQGIGKLLLRRMESILELEGADRVQLDTLSDNVRAVNFYQHQGYRILVLKREGPQGSDPLLSIRLEKRLAPYRGSLESDED